MPSHGIAAMELTLVGPEMTGGARMEQRQHGLSASTLPRARLRRSMLWRGASASMVALLLAHGVAGSMQTSGSISVQGFLCPSTNAVQGGCNATDEIFNGDIVLSGPDEMVLTLDDGESHAVSHFWPGLPYGSYQLRAIGAAPAGYVLDHIDGASTDDAGFEAIVLNDDNPNPSVNLIFVPAG